MSSPSKRRHLPAAERRIRGLGGALLLLVSVAVALAFNAGQMTGAIGYILSRLLLTSLLVSPLVAYGLWQIRQSLRGNRTESWLTNQETSQRVVESRWFTVVLAVGSALRALTSTGNVARFFALLPTLFVAEMIHELGHLAAGMALGFRPQAMRIGPLRFDRTETGWSFGWSTSPISWVAFPAAALEDAAPWRRVCVCVAGPLVNLLCALSWSDATPFTWAFGCSSLVMGVYELVPGRPIWSESGAPLAKDGEQLLITLGLRRPRLIAVAQEQLLQGRRPSLWPVSDNDIAAADSEDGPEWLLERLACGYRYADIGRPSEARREFEKVLDLLEFEQGPNVEHVRVGCRAQLALLDFVADRDARRASGLLSTLLTQAVGYEDGRLVEPLDRYPEHHLLAAACCMADEQRQEAKSHLLGWEAALRAIAPNHRHVRARYQWFIDWIYRGMTAAPQMVLGSSEDPRTRANR
jgi:hypothetical protein